MPRLVWDDTYYVRIYELVKAGGTMGAVADALGVNQRTMKWWYENKPALKEAVLSARAARDGGGATRTGTESFVNYAYGRLPAEMKAVWDEIEMLDRSGAAAERVEEVFRSRPKKMRQSLFAHAMIVTNFNASEACRMVNMSRELWESWQRRDPEFVRMLDHLHQIKKDWAEGKMMQRVALGDTAATIFVNRTLNADRGYNPKVIVEHQGGVMHAHVDIENLELDVDTKRKLLAAVRKQQATMTARATPALPVHTPGDNADAAHADTD